MVKLYPKKLQKNMTYNVLHRKVVTLSIPASEVGKCEAWSAEIPVNFFIQNYKYPPSYSPKMGGIKVIQK